jgi:hypothetical protein
LLIREEELGLLESMVLEVLKKWFQRNVTYREATQAINQENATNISETNFGVVVEKIQNFEVSELFLWIFLRLGTFLELFFKFPGLTVNSWTTG